MNTDALGVLGGLLGGITFMLGLTATSIDRQLDRRRSLASAANRALEAAKAAERTYEPSGEAIALLDLHSESSWASVQRRVFNARVAVLMARLRRSGVEDALGLVDATKSTYRSVHLRAHEMVLTLVFVFSIGSVVMLAVVLVDGFGVDLVSFSSLLLFLFAVSLGIFALWLTTEVRRVTAALVETDGVAIVKEVSDGLMDLFGSLVLPGEARAKLRGKAAVHGMKALGIYENFPLASLLADIAPHDPHNDKTVIARLMVELNAPHSAH